MLSVEETLEGNLFRLSNIAGPTNYNSALWRSDQQEASINSEEFEDGIRCLHASRRHYNAAFHELRGIGRKVTILGRLLAESPTDIWMSTDRESVMFTEKSGGEKVRMPRAELDALPERIGVLY